MSVIDRPTSERSTTPGPASAGDDGIDFRLVGLIGWGAVAATIVALYLPKLSFGLMTDEFLSAWVSGDGFGDAVSRADEFQGNSPVYFVFLWAWGHLVGTGEVALRIPTIVTFVAAIVVMARFAHRVIGPGAGAVAALVLVGSTNTVVRATTARPYGFMLLFVVVSSYALWNWLDDGRRRDGVLWVVTLVLAVSMSPFAAGLGLAHLAWIAEAHRRGGLPAGLPALVGLGAVLSLPLVPQMLSLGGRRSSLVLSVQPSLEELLGQLVPIIPLVIVGIAAAVAGVRSGGAGVAESSILRRLLAWSALPVLTTFFLGAIGDSPVWVERYLVAGLPGGALLVAWCWSRLSARAAMPAAAALAVLCVVVVADYDETQRHGWREAVVWADGQLDVAERDDAVLALSINLIETEEPELLEDPDWIPYLTSSAAYYDQLGLPVVGLPKASSGSDAYFARRLPELLAYDTIVVIDGLDGVPPPDWFAITREAFLDAGYTEDQGPGFASIGVSIFRR